MKEFNNKNIEKSYQKILNLLYVSLFLFVLGGVFIGYSVFKNEKVEPIFLDDIIVNDPKEDVYCYVDIISEPVLFAEYSDSVKKAYFVEDENYLYVVIMNDNTYNDIISKEYPVKLTGYTQYATEDLKEVAIDTMNEGLEEEQFKTSDYEDLFGSVVLDLDTNPLFFNDVLIVIGVLLGFVAIIILIVFVWISIFYKKGLKKLTVEEKEKIAKEVNDEKNAFFYQKANLYLTEHYLINLTNRFEVISYKDIVWMYPFILKQYGFKTCQSIIVVTKDGKKHTIAYMNVITKANKEIYQEIYDTILEKNSKILNGFNKENKDKVKEITNKKAS